MADEILYFYVLCAGIALTLTGYFFARRNGPMLKRGLTILGLLHLLVLILWLGEGACTAFALFLCAVGAYEVTCHALGRSGALILAPVSCAAAVLYGYWLDLWWWAWLAAVAATFAAPYARVASRTWTLGFGLVIVPMGAAALMRLAEPVPIVWMVLILLVQFNDTLSLLVGRLWGRSKPFPLLSPNKSVQGYAAGAVGVVLALTVASLLFDGAVTGPGQGAGSSMIAFAGLSWLFINAGDLLFSKYKRARGIKDFSAILPGHGGVVDRFDSLLVLAPAAWVMLAGGASW